MKLRSCSLLSMLLLPFVQAQEPAPSAAPQPSRIARPKLVVLCSIDQLATWVFDDARPHFAATGGFRRLLDQGVLFTECAYLHGCTETGPGHATIGTGAPASVHGIVKNEWYDRLTKTKMYCASDETALPLEAFPEGKLRGPMRLLVPTVGDLLKVSDPASKVVGVAGKDRSAILMAGGAANSVLWYETGKGRFVTNTRWGKTAPKWLLDYDQKKATDAFFGWTWERFGPAAAYDGLVDDRAFEAPHLSTGAHVLPAVLRGGRSDEPNSLFYNEVYVSPVSNMLVLQVALAAILGEQLGQDEHADLLCISFSANDTIGHYFGPDSVEARDVLLRTDAQLAALLEALDVAVGAGRYAFVVTADHGVALPPEVAKARGLGGGRALLHTQARAAAESALRQHFGVEGGEPLVVHAGEYSLVLDRARIATFAPGADDTATFETACSVAAAACSKVKGIQAGVAAHAVRGQVDDQDPIRRALAYAAHERAGDVMLVPAPYWIEAGLPASHGTAHPYDLRVPLLAMGPMLRRGHIADDAVSPGLAAVFAAFWLGIERPAAAVDLLPESAMIR
jgi:predicted AlkP superfamily pyrophosphatase or phosphodiesterase